MNDSAFVTDYLHVLRTQFYPDDPAGFGQQYSMLVLAITTPANWLEDRGVQLPEKRLREILDEIIVGIKRFGDTGHVKFFCRYFLFAVQEHMKHHGERYYEEGKTLRFIMDTTLEHLSKKQRARLEEAKDATSTRLSELHRLVRQTSAANNRANKAARAAARSQLDLFS